jgi:hypothetical protein
VRGISQQDDLAAHERPLRQQLAIIQAPLPRRRLHARNQLAQHRIPPLKLARQVRPRRRARPALAEVIELLEGLRDERDDVDGLVLADREDEEVFVRREPADCVGGEGPEGLGGGEGEQAAVGYAAAVARLVGYELRAGLRVDAVAGDDEVGGCGGAIFEVDGYFVGAGVLG